MGEAKKRGTREQRIARAKSRNGRIYPVWVTTLFILIILALALVLTGCSAAPYWHDDMPNYRIKDIEIRESETLIADCRAVVDWKGDGCVIRLQDKAIIYVRKGLSRVDYECVMRHEFEHVLGKGHGQGVIYKKMCGQG